MFGRVCVSHVFAEVHIWLVEQMHQNMRAKDEGHGQAEAKPR